MLKVTIEKDHILVECEKCASATEIPLTEDYAKAMDTELHPNLAKDPLLTEIEKMMKAPNGRKLFEHFLTYVNEEKNYPTSFDRGTT